MFAVSRIIAAVARQHLLPPFLARVHKRFGTPHISTILSGVATAVIALFTSFDELLNMVSWFSGFVAATVFLAGYAGFVEGGCCPLVVVNGGC